MNFAKAWQNSLLTLTLGLGVSVSTFGYADSPSGVYIRKIAYGGNGCPQGSVSEIMSPDATAFTLLMDEYIAELGPDVPRRDNRKSCQLAIDIVVPPGWSYSIATFDYRGYANLDRGVQGMQVASYYFQGQGGTGTFSSVVNGAYNDSYQFRDTIGLNAVAWSPCGAARALNVKTEVRLQARNAMARGSMTVDSVDGQVAQVYGLQWRRCSP